jgi:ferrochelatase
MKRAVLIMAYGGPDSLDDVEPYLLDIRGGRPTSPELVAEIRERYARIGGRSPLLEISRAQAQALENCLNELAPAGDTYRVYAGMRHWKPYIREVVAQIAAEGCDGALALCMAPHASRMSTGAYRQKLIDAQEAAPGSPEFDFIESWYDQPFLVQALARRVRAAVERFPEDAWDEIHYLFTAHSLPAVLKEQGDPYAGQLMTTAQLLAKELNLAPEQWSFAFQSAGAAPGEWLGPAIETVLPELARAGKREVLVTPVGFVADHVEILFDLDIEAQEIAHANGILLVRSESLNAAPDFAEGMARMVLARAAAAVSRGASH